MIRRPEKVHYCCGWASHDHQNFSACRCAQALFPLFRLSFCPSVSSSIAAVLL